MSADAEWDRKVKAWTIRRALSKANEDFGPLESAVDNMASVRIRMEGQFGPGWRAEEQGKAEFDKAHARVAAEEEAIARDYYGPQNDAAVALALHPAPDLEGALLKIEMIKVEELHLYLDMPRDPWEIVVEDMARIEREAA